ncbi:MAG: glycosyltransferase [Acidimicrobiales bacterium]
MTSNLSVLVTPRDGLHYQDLLYRDIEASGVLVYYARGPTPSQTLNVLLGPALLGWYRARGCHILHIHWVFQFSLPWARQSQWSRRLMEYWFGWYLRIADAMGYAIVWTAHDLMPHEKVFADDRRARDVLLSRATVVIALSEATAAELREMGARHVRITPMGSYADPYAVVQTSTEARRSFGFGIDDIVVSLIGRIEPYKGADLLLQAVAQLPTTSKVKVLLAGLCSDPEYRRQLDHLASECGGRVISHLEWIPDDDLARYFQAADIAVFPFREVTNSASVLLAQSFGLPIVIPNLTTLSDIPDDSAMRFEPGNDQLVAALQQAERLSTETLRAMSTAGLAWATKYDWTNVAHETVDAFELAHRLRRESARD